MDSGSSVGTYFFSHERAASKSNGKIEERRACITSSITIIAHFALIHLLEVVMWLHRFMVNIKKKTNKKGMPISSEIRLNLGI